MFYSIMFPADKEMEQKNKVPPKCFSDLNLDKIINPILREKKEFELESFFYSPLQDKEVIVYRQDILKNLEKKNVFQSFTNFVDKINVLAKHKKQIETAMLENSSKLPDYFLMGQFFYCIECYCKTVEDLVSWSKNIDLPAVGLQSFLDELNVYANTNCFQRMSNRSKSLRTAFDQLQYCMLIKDDTIRVRKYEEQDNISAQILKSFQKIRQQDAKDYRHELVDMPFASHVETEVLNLLSKLYAQEFKALSALCFDYKDFLAKTIVSFAKEIQFYFGWLEVVSKTKNNSLPFCYPTMDENLHSSFAVNFYDLALAEKIGKEIVCNNFKLLELEKIMVITGPNQGGKTTFARAIGQITYLASLGLSIPGTTAELAIPDKILTHFGKEEDITTLNGQLADDLIRLHDLLLEASSASLIIVNEIFSSTTAQDALLLGEKMLECFKNIKATCLIVTFIDELAQECVQTVSLVSSVSKDNQGKRTFKIVRAKSEGMAYALEIAKRHGLTYEQLDGRLKHAGSSNV